VEITPGKSACVRRCGSLNRDSFRETPLDGDRVGGKAPFLSSSWHTDREMFGARVGRGAATRPPPPISEAEGGTEFETAPGFVTTGSAGGLAATMGRVRIWESGGRACGA